MAKNKISEWDSNPANNTDVAGVDIAEGCAPSGINNAIRQMMAQLKDFVTGADADNQVVGGNLTVTGTTTLSDDLIVSSSSGIAGQALLSQGAGQPPIWGAAFVSGMIMMWSGSIASIPSGWVLCNGSNGTPDLRDKFVIGASVDNAGVSNTTVTGANTKTGGSKDAVVVSHTHSITDSGHTHTYFNMSGANGRFNDGGGLGNNTGTTTTTNSATTGISVNSAGVSGTDANLVPYLALAFIMKT